MAQTEKVLRRVDKAVDSAIRHREAGDTDGEQQASQRHDDAFAHLHKVWARGARRGQS